MKAKGAVHLVGMKEFTRGLRAIDKGLTKEVRKAANESAQIIVVDARGPVPRRTGRAKRSIRAASTQKAVRIREGTKAVSWTPWLDWGGKVGRNKSVSRPRVKEGRYLYPAFKRNKPEFRDRLEAALRGVAASSGIDLR